ncbi:MAG: RpoL/Rpb11 RNA polymerase subunit family protein [Candidatus Micrarchaeia archaeon]
MKINIKKNEDYELQIEFEENILVFPDLLSNKLSEYDEVEFVGVNRSHPEMGKPLLVLKTKKKKAKEVLKKALEELDEDFSELKNQLKVSAKK